jgi:hypothetical protein
VACGSYHWHLELSQPAQSWWVPHVTVGVDCAAPLLVSRVTLRAAHVSSSGSCGGWVLRRCASMACRLDIRSRALVRCAKRSAPPRSLVIPHMLG